MMKGLELRPGHPEVLEPAIRTANLVIQKADEMNVFPVRVTSTACGGIAIHFIDGSPGEYVIIECYNDGESAVLWDSPNDPFPLHWLIGNCEAHSLQCSLEKIQKRLGDEV